MCAREGEKECFLWNFKLASGILGNCNLQDCKNKSIHLISTTFIELEF